MKIMKKCSVEGCGRKHFAKTFCDLHYRRLRRGKSMDLKFREREHKAPNTPEELKTVLDEWVLYMQPPFEELQTPCKMWLRAKDKDGYGLAIYNGATRKTHRLSYELTHGAIPEGKIICHRCARPGCIQPDHLYAGTPADNSADMVKHGTHQIGEKHSNSKLREQDIVNIRDRVAAGETQTALAIEYGIYQSAISKIIKRETWKHVA